MTKTISARLVKKISYISVGLLLFLFCILQQSTAAETAWPEASVVLLPNLPVVHTPQGLKLIDEAAFVDVNNRLLVPLRFLAEELGATVNYESPTITIQRGGSTVILELGSSVAYVNQETIALDTVPQLRNNRTFVPLRFLSEALGFQIHYKDQVIVVGGWFAEVSSAEADTWKTGILTRWETIAADWIVQDIQITKASLATEQFSFFWRYLGENRFALYQSRREDPSMALCLADDLFYDNSHYGQEGQIYSLSFYHLSDACYAVFHTGGATMGSEYLYRFSSDRGSQLILQDRMSGSIAIWEDYLYYTTSEMMSGGTTLRLHLPTFLNGESVVEELIGQPGVTYGYQIQRSDSGASGGPTGFCIVDGFLYANGFLHTQATLRRSDMAFYRIDLETMEHEKLLDRLILNPQIYDGYVYECGENLYRTRLVDGFQELLHRNVVDYYLDGADMVWQEVLNTEDWATEWKRQPVTSLQPLVARIDPQGGEALSGRVTVSFDFVRQSGSASNQYAVWVEDDAGNYIKTLYATQWTAQGGYESRQDSIFNWVAKAAPAEMPRSEIDVISGATPSTGRQSYDWDLTDREGNLVSPGEYRFVVEASMRWRNHIIYPYSFRITARGLGGSNSGPSYNYEATEQHPALDEEALENNIISNVAIRYTP